MHWLDANVSNSPRNQLAAKLSGHEDADKHNECIVLPTMVGRSRK